MAERTNSYICTHIGQTGFLKCASHAAHVGRILDMSGEEPLDCEKGFPIGNVWQY